MAIHDIYIYMYHVEILFNLFCFCYPKTFKCCKDFIDYPVSTLYLRQAQDAPALSPLPLLQGQLGEVLLSGVRPQAV